MVPDAKRQLGAGKECLGRWLEWKAGSRAGKPSHRWAGSCLLPAGYSSISWGWLEVQPPQWAKGSTAAGSAASPASNPWVLKRFTWSRWVGCPVLVFPGPRSSCAVFARQASRSSCGTLYTRLRKSSSAGPC